MKRLIDLETDSEFQEFKEILSKVRAGNIIGTMKQAVSKGNGEYNYVDLQQIVGKATCIFQANGDYFYATVQGAGRATIDRLQSMWNTVLQRGTNRFLENQANDYIFTIDFAKDESEKGFFYCLSAVQPIFMSKAGNNSIMFVFSMNNVRCAKEEASIYDLDYEVALREESGSDVYQFDTDDIGEDIDEAERRDDVLGVADDFISTDKYLNI